MRTSLQDPGTTSPKFSFPAWFWDYNNDGNEDIFVSAYGVDALEVAREFMLNATGQIRGGIPVVFHNNGNNTFADVSKRMGLNQAVFTMGCNFGDVDNDGYLDMYLGTGDPAFSSVVPNKMYRNNAGNTFQDVTTTAGVGHIQKGHGIAFADFDMDGDEDIFHVLGGAVEGDFYENVLFRNPSDGANNWVVFRLTGVKSNRSAIGARLKIVTDKGKVLFRTVGTGGSFGSSSLQAEIGLADATSIRILEVTWPDPDRTVQTFNDIQANAYYDLHEETGLQVIPGLQAFTLGSD